MVNLLVNVTIRSKIPVYAISWFGGLYSENCDLRLENAALLPLSWAAFSRPWWLLFLTTGNCNNPKPVDNLFIFSSPS